MGDFRARDGGTPIFIQGIDEEHRKIMQKPDGFHLGWNVAFVSTVRGTGKTSLIEVLVKQSLETAVISLGHRRTSRGIGMPSVRMRWTPRPFVPITYATPETATELKSFKKKKKSNLQQTDVSATAVAAIYDR